MRQICRTTALGLIFVATGVALIASEAVWQGAQAQPVADIDARVIAINIPGASAIAQVGTFVFVPGGTLISTDPKCTNPSAIPQHFAPYIQSGEILDSTRLLVGSASNFGAPLPANGGREGSLLSIEPSGANKGPSVVPANFDGTGDQASALGGAVQMFSANSQHWLNSHFNPHAFTAQYTGVGNPLGLSNNNGFGRIWPANSPFGLNKVGSSSILDPTGLPLNGAPNSLIGGVYVGDLTNRNSVTPPPPQVGPPQPQVIPGALQTGAVFAVVTADGAIVQEHTLYGLDGLAPPGTVRPILGSDGNAQDEANEPRFGTIMNPYIPSSAPSGTVRQLFVSELFSDTIAVVNLTVSGTAPYQVFGLGSVTRISSPALNLPVDLTSVKGTRTPPAGPATRRWMRAPTSMSPIRATTRSFACSRTAQSSRCVASPSTDSRSTTSA